MQQQQQREQQPQRGSQKYARRAHFFAANLFLFLPLLVFCCCCYCCLYATPCENANDPGTHTHADMHTRALTVWFVTLSARCLALSLPLSFTCANVN